jgi:[acyl-carrier-protein] S-malonyltransferase
MSGLKAAVLCPGQGAQAVGMGRAWFDASEAARETFKEADRALGDALGAPLSEICFNGPAERLNQTDVSQPAIYVCSIACHRALAERNDSPPMQIVAAAGLSLGEYTALHLAGVFSFVDGLKLVAQRGQCMQDAAEASRGGMVALIGADEAQAQQVCDRATLAGSGEVLVSANFNAPGQIVLSGHSSAVDRVVRIADEMGLKATPLTVAGAFHSPLMQPAADRMAAILSEASFQNPNIEVWSNVTARPHEAASSSTKLELIKQRLVEQIVRPVRWSETCQRLASSVSVAYNGCEFHELAPGSVLRGLMRRIDRNIKVVNHDQP